MEEKKSLISRTVIILVLMIILVLSLKLLFSSKNISFFGNIEKDKSIDSSIIIEKIERIWDISVIKYHYSNVISYKENKKLKEFELPFTQKSFLIKYDGYIKAGIKADNIKVEHNEGANIKLIVGKSKIIDHVIDEDTIHVYDEKSSIFNGLSIKDVFDQIVLEKEDIEGKLTEKGFLEEADKNVKILLEELLKEFGFEEIEILIEADDNDRQ